MDKSCPSCVLKSIVTSPTSKKINQKSKKIHRNSQKKTNLLPLMKVYYETKISEARYSTNFSVFICIGSRISKKQKEQLEKLKQKQRDQARKRKERQREKEKNDIPNIPSITEEQFTASVKQFEIKNKNLAYKRCTGCHQVRLGMKVKSYTIGEN